MTTSHTPIETFPGEEGIEVRVFDLGSYGFSVMLYDTDSGESLPGPRCSTRERAVTEASRLAQGKGR